MTPPRTLPLFDPHARPSSWNERMSPGEFAVHSSHGRSPSDAHFCAIFRSLADAEQYAVLQTSEDPTLRCRIYDHRGFVGAAQREIAGRKFKGELDFSPRTRRLLGAVILITGIVLFCFDWINDFRYDWPSVVGSRLLIPGAVLLATEFLIALTHWHKEKQQARERTSA